MPTYRAMAHPPAGWVGDEWYEPERESITVYEPDHAPHRTGLVDANGVPIYRLPERRAIGFCRD